MQTLQRGRSARRLVERQHGGRWRQLLTHQRVASAAGMFARPLHALWFVGTGSPRRECPELVEAILRGDRAGALTLLEQRASPDSFDSRGMGALHVACAQVRPPLPYPPRLPANIPSPQHIRSERARRRAGCGRCCCCSRRGRTSSWSRETAGSSGRCTRR